MNIIDEVLTISEAAEKYNKSTSTLRRNFDRGVSFKHGVDIRKSGSTWLVTKAAMEREYGE
ncbi:helix-turn-helix domain-containing protein [Orenia marismortui]|uniref:helix-turn-helix domain-containing protein n=1 Tax=Orenia marismortui TaxID=46469 RepID=UPI00036D5715|nr:helix-turn-helix domain-containing protein [Orenia marismortui]